MTNPTPGACLLQDRICSPGRSCWPGASVASLRRRQVQNSSLLVAPLWRKKEVTNREKKGESHGEVCFLDPSSFHWHHPDCGVLPVPGGRWLDPERYTREFPGEPALAR